VDRVTRGPGAAGGCQDRGSGAEGTESGADTETRELAENHQTVVYRSRGANSGDTGRAGGRFVASEETERFLVKVAFGDPGGCWLWTGQVNESGYGHFRRRDGRTVKAHRFAYETARGPIPEGLTLDHLCGRPRCVRPTHLEPVTNAENLRRRHARQRAARTREENDR
jgi:HNH endonuclease